MKNLIIGVVDNYHFPQISNFVISLSKTTYDGEICLAAGPHTSISTIKSLRNYDVSVIRFSNPENVRRSDALYRYLATLSSPVHIYNYRHLIYLSYIEANRHRISNVMLSDVRDVYFQRDPFDFAIENSIYVASEREDIPIAKESWTRKWIELGYGPDIAESLGQYPVICAGTTIAPVDLMIKYLKAMYDEMTNVSDLWNVADQGIHNYLVHTGKLGRVQILRNFSGPIATLGTSRDYLLGEEDRLVNQDGSVINTIHQYDQKPELVAILEKRLYGRLAWRKLELAVWNGITRARRVARTQVRRVLAKFR